MLQNISLSKPQVRRSGDVKAFEQANELMEDADFYMEQLKDGDQSRSDRHKEQGVVVLEYDGRDRHLVGSLEFDPSSKEMKRSDFSIATYRGKDRSVQYEREGDLERFSIRDRTRGGLAGRIGGADYLIERNQNTDTLVSFQERGVIDKFTEFF